MYIKCQKAEKLYIYGKYTVVCVYIYVYMVDFFKVNCNFLDNFVDLINFNLLKNLYMYKIYKYIFYANIK